MKKIKIDTASNEFLMLVSITTAAVVFLLMAAPVHATLHAFCGSSTGNTTCFDNGTITPTTENPLSPFGFGRSPDSNSSLTTPIFDLVFLIPNNVAGATTQSLIDTGTNTGIAGPLTANLFSTTAWTINDLLFYLSLTGTGGPNNPIGAYLPSTQGYDPGATGYFVYQANFGSVNFALGDPYFANTNLLPEGAVILGLIEGSAPGIVQDATANSSGALIIDTPVSVPEPATLILLGSGLAGLGFWRLTRIKG